MPIGYFLDFAQKADVRVSGLVDVDGENPFRRTLEQTGFGPIGSQPRWNPSDSSFAWMTSRMS